MSLITNKQQELIDHSIDQFIKTYDKVSHQYLTARKQILQLSTEATKNGDLNNQQNLQLQKLRYELDSSWENYNGHLNGLKQNLRISKEISPHYVDQLNSQHEILLTSKLSLSKTIKNIKEVQVPLLDNMKKIIQVFEKDLSKATSTRYPTKDFINKAIENPSPKSMDVNALIISKTNLYEIFQEFDDKVKDLKTVYDVSEMDHSNKTTTRPIKASSYINQELESREKFVALENDQYLFKVSKIGHQDSFLANASVSEYDKLNDQLTRDITELINHATSAKENWVTNAKKIDGFKQIVNDHQDVEMTD